MIYADNAATTKISDVAFSGMLPFLQDQYGNPSSPYSFGTKAKRAIGQARQLVASAIGAQTDEITFTSGGSEGNSWVLRSIVDIYNNKPLHVIISTIEHSSIMSACRILESKGIEITYLPVDHLGRISINNLKSAIRPNTKLVSIMFANNEIGTIQPIAEIGRYLSKMDLLFHTDAVQAVGHIPINVKELNVDFLTASAHKFNGAKGTGILYKRPGLDFYPLVFGGGQENGFRGGTENVAGIVAAGYALDENVSIMNDTTKLLNELVDITIEGIENRIPNLRINGDIDNGLPGIINFCFDGISGDSLVHLLDFKGICISTSSACMSGENKPSHVLMALGMSGQQARSSIRISYGRYNTITDAKCLVDALYLSYSKIKGSIKS